MRLLADENVKGRLVKWLNQSGHDAATAPKGLGNSHLFDLASKEGRILLTNDVDFTNTALYPPEESSGILVLRVFPPTFENQGAHLTDLFSLLSEEDIKRKLVVLWIEGFETRIK